MVRRQRLFHKPVVPSAMFWWPKFGFRSFTTNLIPLSWKRWQMHGRDNRGNLHEEEKLFYVIFDDDIVFSLFQIWILYDWRKVGIRREIFYKDTLFQGSLIRWNKGNSAMETLRLIQTPPVSTRLGLNSYRHASPWASLELYLIQSLKYGITSWVARKIWNPTTHLIVDGKRKGYL